MPMWRLALCLAGATGLLVGCSSLGLPFGSAQGDTYVRPFVLRQAQDDRFAQGDTPGQGDTASWVLPEAKSEPLLYVSDGKFGSVYIFSYPAGKLVGELKGLDLPEGVCSDRTGNVYIVTQSNSTISEYAHGGMQPIKTLGDPNGSPLGCSVDPRSGDLAVSNEFGPISGSGWPPNVLIFKHARGTPATYQEKTMLYLYFCGYDAGGNLFVDGQLLSNGSDGLAELPKGKNGLVEIALDPNVSVDGGIQWDGTYLAAGNDSGSSGHATIYRLTVRNGKGRVVHQTSLDGDNDILSFWIGHRTLVGGDLTQGTVMYWNYPQGGNATKSLSGFSDPVAMTVSAATRF